MSNNTELVQHMSFHGCGVSDVPDFLRCKNLNQTISRMLLQCLRLFPMEFIRNGSCYLAPTSQQSAVPGSPECKGVFWPSATSWWLPACLTARPCTLRHLPVPQADYHAEGETFQNFKTLQRHKWIWHGSCSPFWNRSITHAMTVEGWLESFHAGWRILLSRKWPTVTCQCFSNPPPKKNCPRYFLSSLVWVCLPQLNTS